MKGQHDTYLIYAHQAGLLEVGLVTCVPRVGDIVMIAPDKFTRSAHKVDEVMWSPPDDARVNAYTSTPYTVVRVLLSRCG